MKWVWNLLMTLVPVARVAKVYNLWHAYIQYKVFRTHFFYACLAAVCFPASKRNQGNTQSRQVLQPNLSASVLWSYPNRLDSYVHCAPMLIVADKAV